MPLVAADLDGLSLYGQVFAGVSTPSCAGRSRWRRRWSTGPGSVGWLRRAWRLFGGGLLVAGLAPSMDGARGRARPPGPGGGDAERGHVRRDCDCLQAARAGANAGAGVHCVAGAGVRGTVAGQRDRAGRGVALDVPRPGGVRADCGRAGAAGGGRARPRRRAAAGCAEFPGSEGLTPPPRDRAGRPCSPMLGRLRDLRSDPRSRHWA